MKRALPLVVVALLAVPYAAGCVGEGPESELVVEELAASALENLRAGETVELDLSEANRVVLIPEELSHAQRQLIDVRLTDGTVHGLAELVQQISPDADALTRLLLVAAPSDATDEQLISCRPPTRNWDVEACGGYACMVGGLSPFRACLAMCEGIQAPERLDAPDRPGRDPGDPDPSPADDSSMPGAGPENTTPVPGF